jgi:type II secretory pathway pseudopilin PulG
MALTSKPSRGFSLLELFVASALIGIELLATDKEKWPGPKDVGSVTDQEVCDLNAGNAGLVVTNGGFPNWDGPYMQSVQKNPWEDDMILLLPAQYLYPGQRRP